MSEEFFKNLWEKSNRDMDQAREYLKNNTEIGRYINQTYSEKGYDLIGLISATLCMLSEDSRLGAKKAILENLGNALKAYDDKHLDELFQKEFKSVM